MPRRAERGAAHCGQARVAGSGGDLFRENCRAALDEIKTGLLNCLHTDPEKAADRTPVRRSDLEPLCDGELAREAGVRLLRLLFLLFADGRRLRKDGLGVMALGAEPTGLLSGLELPDLHLRRAVRFLGGAVRPGGKGVSGHAYAEKDVRGLGDAYEVMLEYPARETGSCGEAVSLRSVSSRKRTGRYYTPNTIVKYLVREALGRRLRGLSSREILRVRVLDPAMGSGHFLLRVVDYMAAAYGRALARENGRTDGKSSEGRGRYRSTVVKRCIYGVDNDPVAVEVARMSLWLLAGGGRTTVHALKKHIRCGDALLGTTFDDDTAGPCNLLAERDGASPGEEGPNPVKPFHWGLEFPEVVRDYERNRRSGFDIVLGNPPYVSFSGRQGVGGVHAFPRCGKAASRPKGWPSAHGLFILRAPGLLADAGLLSFITPGQVGHLRGYGPVRAGLLETCDLIEVRYWGEGVFRGVTTPALTFIARRRVRYRRPVCLLKTEDGGIDRFRAVGERPWFVSPYRHTLNRMAELHPTLDTFGDPGVHTGNIAARILGAARKQGWVPVIEGKQVHPFRCDRPRKWFNPRYKPSGDEYFRVSDSRVYRDTDIVIRQTASRPMAARHVHGCHFRNSLLALVAPEGFSVEYLLGILNSDAAAVLYRAIAPESRQRAFPQIKVNALRQLPIPDPRLRRNRPAVARIERTVRTIETRMWEGGSTAGLINTLNQLVCGLYGIQGHK